MMEHLEISWQAVYDYALACSREHDAERFMRAVLENMNDFVPIEQGFVYCLDENQQVVTQNVVNINASWADLSYKYYNSFIESNGKGLSDLVKERFDLPFVEQIVWDEEAPTEFIEECIRPNGIRCTLIIVFFDQNSIPRAIASFTRTQKSRFTEREMAMVRYATALLHNVYKSFFTNPATIPGSNQDKRTSSVSALLTKREREVVDLMCGGLSPALVSKKLDISISTTYKHIAHIYKKLGVSSQQELLVRVLRPGD